MTNELHSMSAPSYLFPNKMVVKLIGYLYDELKNIKRNIIYGEDTKEMTVFLLLLNLRAQQ